MRLRRSLPRRALRLVAVEPARAVVDAPVHASRSLGLWVDQPSPAPPPVDAPQQAALALASFGPQDGTPDLAPRPNPSNIAGTDRVSGAAPRSFGQLWVEPLQCTAAALSKVQQRAGQLLSRGGTRPWVCVCSARISIEPARSRREGFATNSFALPRRAPFTLPRLSILPQEIESLSLWLELCGRIGF